VLASMTALRPVTGAVRTGRRSMVDLPGRTHPFDAAEVTGLAL